MLNRKIFGLILIQLSVCFACFGQKVSLEESENGFNFVIGDQIVLTYQTAVEEAPAGVDEVFGKSGFIHPMKSLSGQVLTRIQPEDHYHHYGIWGPYTRASIDGREVDFWNLGDKKGRVDFSHVLSKKEAGGVAELNVRQNHLDLKAKPSNQLAIKEDLRIKVKPISSDRYMVEYTTTIFTDLEEGILLDDYRYGGGIGFRGTEIWDTDNSEILISAGDDRTTADGKNARWVMVTGETDYDSGQSGVLFLSHNTNKSHPEPMRVWPVDSYDGKANVFIEFCPIRHESWEILPGKRYTLKYRMIVFDGELSEKEANKYWVDFVK